jgi:hypothetical protein
MAEIILKKSLADSVGSCDCRHLLILSRGPSKSYLRRSRGQTGEIILSPLTPMRNAKKNFHRRRKNINSPFYPDRCRLHGHPFSGRPSKEKDILSRSIFPSSNLVRGGDGIRCTQPFEFIRGRFMVCIRQSISFPQGFLIEQLL